MRKNADFASTKAPIPRPEVTKVRRAGRKEKTERAFRAYLDLLNAADYLRAQVRGQLELLGLTMRGFQALEMLAREGPMRTMEMAERCQCNRQNLAVILRGLEKDGWVRVKVESLPAAEIEDKRLPKARRGRRREGRRVGWAALTAEGKAFAARILPRHRKVVKAFLRAIDGRQQESLSTICQKLVRGDVMKFIREMEYGGT